MDWTIGITHPEEAIDKFFTEQDLARLRGLADLRILGPCRKQDISHLVGDVDILLGSWGMVELSESFLASAPRLKAVCYAAGSVKNFITDAVWERGLLVTTAMHANAIPVAEVTMALIILANKNWFPCQDAIRRKGQEGFYEARKEWDCHGNYGAKVGLIGYGAIGREVHKRLKDLHLEVHIHDPFVGDDRIRDSDAIPATLQQIAQRCDVVSLHAPNIPETRHMLSTDFFTAMRDGAVFINTARGALVDEDALVAELETGRIQAMLDVTMPEPPVAGHPFYTLPNCWLTPHRAGSAGDEVRRMGAYAVEECVRVITGEPPRFPVRQEMLATMA